MTFITAQKLKPERRSCFGNFDWFASGIAGKIFDFRKQCLCVRQDQPKNRMSIQYLSCGFMMCLLCSLVLPGGWVKLASRLSDFPWPFGASTICGRHMFDITSTVGVSMRATRLVEYRGIPVLVFIKEWCKHAYQNTGEHRRVFCFFDNR